MKTTKKLAILSLALIMCLSAVTPSFSWFTHNAEYNGETLISKGKGISYRRDDLPVSKGGSGISAETKAYQMDGEKIALDANRNKLYKTAAQVNDAVAAGSIQFYRTTFTKTGAGTAYLNLYLNNITNHVDVKVGANYPTVNEQSTGKSEREVVPNPAMRIYFEPRDAKGWNGDSMYLYAKPVGGSYPASGTAMTKADGSTNSTAAYFTSNSATNKKTFFCDLPSTSVTEEFFISKESTLADALNFQRTRSFSSYVPQTVYSLTGYSTNDNNLYAACETRIEDGAMSVPYTLKSVTASAGGTVYVSLPRGYKGCSVEYKMDSSDSDYYNLQEQSGLLTITNQGTNPITTTVTGTGLGDAVSFKTTVRFNSTTDNIPICRNIKVAQNEEVIVEWYIRNDTGASVSFNASNLYVTY